MFDIKQQNSVKQLSFNEKINQVAKEKESPWNARIAGDMGFNPGLRRSPTMPHGQRAWQPTKVFLPGDSHGQRHLAGYSPWGHTDSNKQWACMHTTFVIAVLPRSSVLISWQQSPSTVILETPKLNLSLHPLPLFSFPWNEKTGWHNLMFLNAEF